MAISKQSKGSPELDQRVIQLYKVARKSPEDTHLQESVSIIKTLRRSIAGIKVWNVRYQGKISALNLDIERMKGELSSLNQEMLTLGEEKQRIIAERGKLLAELKHIETEVQVAAIKVKRTKDVFGKLNILWHLLKSLFLDESFELGKIDNNPEPDENKPQMRTNTADNNRSLLDK